jgi:hypothetical protein
VSEPAKRTDVPCLGLRWKAVSTRAFIAALAALGVLLLLYWNDADGYLLGLDDLNLAFHEAGHLIFGLFGDTLNLYGGTLGQLVFPIAVTLSFARRGETLGVFTGLVWTGENGLNIARYAADARAKVLPLLGNGEHDWAWIFSRWDVLNHDVQIAGGMRFLSYSILVSAVVLLFRVWNESEAPASAAKEGEV